MSRIAGPLADLRSAADQLVRLSSAFRVIGMDSVGDKLEDLGISIEHDASSIEYETRSLNRQDTTNLLDH